MNWFKKKDNEKEKKSEYDDLATIPPFGSALVPEPIKPKSLKDINLHNSNIGEFKGFTPPPKYEYEDNTNDYDDFKYTKYNSNNFFDSNFTYRTKACIENIKMGVKMGSMVGAIFGALTGTYASFAHKNLYILPVSLIGGAVSFGFFLGCGMIVRC